MSSPLSAAPRLESEIRSWDIEVDVLVVGLGCAGACATLEARAGGADVLVLERAGGGGGTSSNSAGDSGREGGGSSCTAPRAVHGVGAKAGRGGAEGATCI